MMAKALVIDEHAADIHRALISDGLDKPTV